MRDELEDIAAKEHVTISVIMREALTAEIARYRSEDSATGGEQEGISPPTMSSRVGQPTLDVDITSLIVPLSSPEHDAAEAADVQRRIQRPLGPPEDP
jgi:hypothetical protein